MRLQTPLMRRSVLAMLAAAAPLLAIRPAFAANVAEAFVGDNINRGLGILNNKQLSVPQRRDQFESFLLGLVDIRRIGLFTLGQYRRSASPEDTEAFIAAFKNYATAAYQSYFSKYSGQTLKVTGSTERAPHRFHRQHPADRSRVQPAAGGCGFSCPHRYRQAGTGGRGLSGHLAVSD